MAVNISKTKFIIFHTRGKIIGNDNITLTIDDNEPGNNDPNHIFTIERVHNNHTSLDKRSYKFLGIHLDEHLSFDHHIELLCNKLNRSLFCINRAKKLPHTKSTTNTILCPHSLPPNILSHYSRLHTTT
jgi:hypothetical protein